MTRQMRTIAYVDGLNLYYRAVKGTPHKWLDLEALLRGLLRPENDLVRIRYFTADVSGRRDPSAPLRQQAYLRALGRNSVVSIHKGNFL
ncbi:MAG: NYN domain-containing protein, partial [Chloroflexi bacterium]|nr:NYN domain-containing protein [Chloroflexota bacterium]